MNKDEILHETGMYKVVVGNASTTEHPRQVYLVINKMTDVVEIELSMLVRALAYADQLQAEYDAWLDKVEEEGKEVSLRNQAPELLQ